MKLALGHNDGGAVFSLVLLNDVSTEYEENKLIVGDLDVRPSKTGQEQAVVIGARAQSFLGTTNLIVASDALRVRRLLHHLRAKSVKTQLSNKPVQYVAALRERSFGVLNGTRYAIHSDLFRHTRITAEMGESINQVRNRAISYLLSVCSKGQHVLAVSHPFVCQIVSNTILNRDHTTLTSFWFKKGAILRLCYEIGNFGYRWRFDGAGNLLDDRTFTLEQIYSDQIETI